MKQNASFLIFSHMKIAGNRSNIALASGKKGKFSCAFENFLL